MIDPTPEQVEAAAPEHSYEAIRTDIISALAADGFAYLEAEQLVRQFEILIRASTPERVLHARIRPRTPSEREAFDDGVATVFHRLRRSTSMTNPTPEQVEAAARGIYALDPWLAGGDRRFSSRPTLHWDELGDEDHAVYVDQANAALVAAAGALLVAPALPISDDRSQSGDTDSNGGEDGPEHEWGSHPETVAADTGALIAEARTLAARKVEDSADAEALQIMVGLLCDRLEQGFGL